VNIEMCGDLAQGVAALQVGPANELVAARFATLIGVREQASQRGTIQQPLLSRNLAQLALAIEGETRLVGANTL
jgi:hypothetical protein